MVNSDKPQSYDALLILSFGGPEGPADVRPFLENVTRGRGIPPERLDEVGAHYAHFGGVSPLNEHNRTLQRKLQARFDAEGRHLPVYFGNRNWKPFATDIAQEMAAAGHQQIAVFATSAWGGYSGCRQYDEDIIKMREVAPLNYTKLPQFFAHPLFIAAQVRAAKAAFAQLSAAEQADARLIFTAHSIPTAADQNSGTPTDGPLYSRQVAAAASLVAAELGIDSYDVVWQSRSGAPHIPWLEPDIVDHVAATKPAAIVVVPIGFISDHIEVLWDLDHELAAACQELGCSYVRADTADSAPEFLDMIVDLLDNAPQVRQLSDVPARGCTTNGELCAPDCCPTRRPSKN